MTSPGGSSGITAGQFGVTGTDGSVPAKQAHTQANVTSTLQSGFTSNQFAGLGGGLISMILSFFTAGIGAILGGFGSVLDAIFSTVNDSYVRDLPTITDHTHSITALQAAFNQLILQGNALVFPSNNTYTPTAGILSIDVIMIGGGAGGAGGGTSGGGGGGGGGGELHTSIPASLLPQSGGVFTPITITIGAFGAGGASATGGTGGGNTIFGSSLLIAGGGNGGAAGSWNSISGAYTSGPGGVGGAGMIPGGTGGTYGDVAVVNPNATNSTSAYSLNGGGGGGGAGQSSAPTGSNPGIGGVGGASAGGSPGNAGTAPSSVVATGGGGGGGALTSAGAGAGAYPAGGGGGGHSSAAGAAGGAGILYIIERSS